MMHYCIDWKIYLVSLLADFSYVLLQALVIPTSPWPCCWALPSTLEDLSHSEVGHNIQNQLVHSPTVIRESSPSNYGNKCRYPQANILKIKPGEFCGRKEERL